MKTEEIEKAAQLESDNLTMYASKWDFKRGFHKGVEFSDKHWQEKTRWKSLEKEPPTEYEYDKMYLFRTEVGNPYLAPLPYVNSIKEYIDCGFIEWKEIE